MRNRYKFLPGILPLLCACILAVGCDKSVPVSAFAVDVETTEYQGLCQDDLTKNAEMGVVYAIRSQAEFDKYIALSEFDPGRVFGEIDFTKHTLLLVYGRTTSGIYETESVLRNAGGRYVLSVNVEGNATCVIGVWIVAMLVEDFPVGAEVRLDLKTHNTTPITTWDY